VNIGLGGDGPGFSTQPMNLTLCECDRIAKFSLRRLEKLLQGWLMMMRVADDVALLLVYVVATSVNYLLVATIDCAGCVDGGLA
jgi:hypothetical protein